MQTGTEAQETRPLRVEVAAPTIAGECVTFRWQQNAPNPFQHVDEFFFRYEGIDLAAFSPLLFYEVFLALQLRVFAAYQEPVEVEFPEPLPRSSVEFWRAFHDAEGVTIGPIQEAIAYDPWRDTRAAQGGTWPNAVFFGGGKDSTLATCLLSELYGKEQVLLVQYVGPLRDDPKLWDRLERRQETMMLQPARERLGVGTRRVWTDYQAGFRPEGYGRRPHYELYTAGALPTLLAHGVSLCTISVERVLYPTRLDRDGHRVYRYAKSRPEMLAVQSRHYHRTLGVDLRLTNLNLPFTKPMTFRMLAERYPEALRLITMCTRGRVDQRWCYDCPKCGLFALLGLAYRAVDPAFDYDRFLRESPYIRRLVEYAAGNLERSCHGNALWQPFLSGPRVYPAICHLLHLIDVDALPVTLGPEANANLVRIKELFGHRAFPDEEVVLRQTLDLLGSELGSAVGALAARHFPVVVELAGPHLAGNSRVEYEFAGKMPTKTARLAHLADDAETGPVEGMEP